MTISDLKSQQPPRAALFLREADVCKLLTMQEAINAVQEVFQLQGENEANNLSRSRIHSSNSILHSMGGSIPSKGVIGSKVYVTPKQGFPQFLVTLFEEKTGAVLAMIQADHLGRIRTGAASAIATRWMSRPESTRVGLFGTGRQASTQLLGICQVRQIQRVHVYSPNPEHRRDFSRKMAQECLTEVVPVNRPELAVEGMDILVTATTSRDPVLDGRSIQPGTHINAIGSNFKSKAELDSLVFRRCHRVVVDSLEQARMEAGDLIRSESEGSFSWDKVHELCQIVTGQIPGRGNNQEVTLFKSLGIGMEDIAVACRLHDLAKENGFGQIIDW